MQHPALLRDVLKVVRRILFATTILVLTASCLEDNYGPNNYEEMESELEEELDWESRVYWLAEDENIKIGVQGAPIGPKINEEVQAWKADGVDVVVSNLQTHEIETLGLEEEESLCEEFGIHYISFPIQDFSIPDDPEVVNLLCKNIIIQLDEGKGVVFHCRGGLGRSPTFAACVLVKMGYTTAEAFDLISTARGTETPETAQQVQFVLDFEAVYGG